MMTAVLEYFDKWAVLDEIGWDPHPGQLRIAESTARHRVASCGRRFGKSDLGGHELVPEALYAFTQRKRLADQLQRREFWVVGPQYCVDSGTEILTTRGWLREHQLNGDETVLTLNMETGLAEWQAMEYVTVFHTLPGLHRHVYESNFRGHNSVTTGEHRWPVRSGRHDLLKWTTTEEIGSSRDRLITVAPVADLPQELKYRDALVELVAWYWTEGTWSEDGKTLELAQNAGPLFERMKAACRELFGEPRSSMRSGNKPFSGLGWVIVEGKIGRCNAIRLSADAARLVRQESIINDEQGVREKAIDPRFILNLTRNQLELFLNISVWADRDSRWDPSTGIELGQKYECNIDIMQMVCQLLGRRSQKFTRFYEGKLSYALSIYSLFQTGDIGTNMVKRTQVKRAHQGVVWCPKTSNGTWLMRRNGSVCFTGNSDAEKEFRVLWNELNRLEVPFDKPGSYNDPVGGSLHISLWGGLFQVHGKSAKYPEQLVGEGLSGAILAEAAKMKPSIWVKYIRPALSDFSGWSLHTSTPEGKNHFYDLWKLGKDPGVPDWASWRMPSWVNPYVYKTPTKREDVRKLQDLMADELRNLGDVEDVEVEIIGRLRALCNKYGLEIDGEILDIMSSTSTEAFNQEIGADFTSFTGRVFKDFDEELHVGDLEFNPSPSWHTFACVDYGFRNPNVWLVLQVGPWDHVNVLHELYLHEYTIDEFADEILVRGLDKHVECFYPDPASPGDSNILMDKLHIPWRGGTGGPLKDRLDAIRKALKEYNVHVPRGHVDRRPQLMFDRSCSMSIDEMTAYRYPDKRELSSVPGQECPQKKDDHVPEAIGRFFAGHYSTPQEEAGPGRVTRARMRRR